MQYVWIAGLFAVGAVSLVLLFWWLQRIYGQPVRPIVGFTAAPIDGTWYLWIVTTNGDCYVRPVSAEALNQPLRCLGSVWTANTWDYSRL